MKRLACVFIYPFFSLVSLASSERGLPYLFLKNSGQWDKNVHYQGFVNGVSAVFMKEGVSFVCSREKDNPELEMSSIPEIEYARWNLQFVNCNSGLKLQPYNEQNSKCNYYLGNDISKWVLNVPQYSEIVYSDIYYQTDLKYYGTGEKLKYDFVLRKGASVNDIQLRMSGIKKLTITSRGTLYIHHPWGIIEEDAPYTYQYVDGEKREINVSYRLLNDTTFGFILQGNYNEEYDVIIDPLTMKWCSFLGATGNNSNNYSYDVATDPAGNIYVTGLCDGTYPVTAGVAQTAFGGPFAGTVRTDAFVSKFDRNGTTLLYSTYLGGTGNDFSHGIKVNAAGEAFITGSTMSPNFPTSAGSYKTAFGGAGTVFGDAFVTKLNANGSLAYSTFLSGSGAFEEVGWDIDINVAGEAYVTGKTNDAAGFPLTAGRYQAAYGGGASDAFVVKFNAAGNNILYSSFIGGNDGDEGCGIILSATGEIFFCGNTFSTDFPVSAGAYQSAYGGCTPSGPQYGDAFATKLNAAGNILDYSTFLGGTCMENAEALDINAAGEAFVTGKTCSNDFPITAGVFQSARTSGWEIFVTRLNVNGTNAVYSTYIGGNNPDEAYDIAVNCYDQAYIVGYTSATAYPVVIPSFQAANAGFQDHVLSLLNAAGTALLASTYIGGAGLDYFTPGIVLDESNCLADTIIFNGTTHSPDYPSTPNRYQSAKINGGTSSDQPVLAKMIFDRDIITLMASGSTSICNGDSVQLNVNGVSGNASYQWTPVSGINNSTISNPVAQPTSSTKYYITVQKLCCQYTDSITITVNQIPVANAGNDTTICEGGNASINASGGNAYSWSTGATDASINVSPAAQTSYTVTAINGNCMDTDEVTVFVNPLPTVIAGTNTTIILGSGVQLTSTTGGASYVWSPANGLSCISCADPFATPTITTTYYVIVTDVNGCTARDSVIITVDTECGDVFVPNAFSPNEDGENDILYVYTNAACVKNFMLRIYDRWGEIVFETTDVKQGWNGMFRNKKENSGVFAYQLTLLSHNNTPVNRSGNITLVK